MHLKMLSLISDAYNELYSYFKLFDNEDYNNFAKGIYDPFGSPSLCGMAKLTLNINRKNIFCS